MALTGTTGAGTNPTTVAADALNFYDTLNVVAKTLEPAIRKEVNYKDTSQLQLVTPTGTDTKQLKVISIDRPPLPTEPVLPVPGRRFRGVVDRVQPENADVTLFYGDRENHFTIPTFLLQQGKMDYAGALFEIVLTQRDGLQSYDFNHLIAEEQAARQAGTPMDLSFLEFLQNGSTAGSRK